MNLKEIIIVVAHDKNFAIGYNGDLPEWKLRDDMKHFKTLTEGHSVVTGRRTFESFDERYRPLPNRYNFLITRKENYTPYPTNDQTFVCDGIMSAINRAAEKTDKVFIIGGGEIYAEALQLGICRKIIASVVDGEFMGDTFFPRLDPRYWKGTVRESFEKNERNSHKFSIVEYERR